MRREEEEGSALSVALVALLFAAGAAAYDEDDVAIRLKQGVMRGSNAM